MLFYILNDLYATNGSFQWGVIIVSTIHSEIQNHNNLCVCMSGRKVKELKMDADHVVLPGTDRKCLGDDQEWCLHKDRWIWMNWLRFNNTHYFVYGVYVIDCFCYARHKVLCCILICCLKMCTYVCLYVYIRYIAYHK